MNENIIRIRAVANGLKSIEEDVFFIGGAVVSLYADNIETFEHRHTEDVDVLVEILTRGKYYKLQERLRDIGFQEDPESKIICRWKYQGISVDVMPLNKDVIGFSNQWYIEGINNYELKLTDDGHSIRIFKFPYFFASKLEALRNRGRDLRLSKDFEDIIRVLEARTESINEIKKADRAVHDFIVSEISRIKEMKKSILIEAISTLLYPNNSEERVWFIYEKMMHILR